LSSQQPAAGSKNKSKKKAAAEEEDIDAILAELAIDTSKTKKDEGSDKQTPVEADRKVKLAAQKSATVEWKQNMTQEEIAKAMEEMYDLEDDAEDGKRKKRKIRQRRKQRIRRRSWRERLKG